MNNKLWKITNISFFILIARTQICRNINSIKVCMETGSTVVLLNLENLYESLYDALNQVWSCNMNSQILNILQYIFTVLQRKFVYVRNCFNLIQLMLIKSESLIDEKTIRHNKKKILTSNCIFAFISMWGLTI